MKLFRACAAAVAFLTLAPLARADKPDDKSKVKLELRRAETKAAEGLVEAAVPGSKEKIYLHKTADVTNEDVAGARVVEDAGKKPAIEVVFTKDGAKKAAKLSDEHSGKPLAVLIDGKVVSALVVKAKLSDRALVTGTFTKKEAEKLANGLTGK